MLEKTAELKQQFEEKINKIKSSIEAEQLKVEFLGKKGHVSGLMAALKNATGEQKKEAGKLINELKQYVETKVQERNSPNSAGGRGGSD